MVYSMLYHGQQIPVFIRELKTVRPRRYRYNHCTVTLVPITRSLLYRMSRPCQRGVNATRLFTHSQYLYSALRYKECECLLRRGTLSKQRQHHQYYCSRSLCALLCVCALKCARSYVCANECVVHKYNILRNHLKKNNML